MYELFFLQNQHMNIGKEKKTVPVTDEMCLFGPHTQNNRTDSLSSALLVLLRSTRMDCGPVHVWCWWTAFAPRGWTTTFQMSNLTHLEFWAPMLMPLLAWWATRECALMTRNRYWGWKKQWMTEFCRSTTLVRRANSPSFPLVDIKGLVRPTVVCPIVAPPLDDTLLLVDEPVTTCSDNNSSGESASPLSPTGGNSQSQNVTRMMDLWRGREYPLRDVLHFDTLKCLLPYRWFSDGAVLLFPLLSILWSPGTIPLLSCMLSTVYLCRIPFFCMTVLIPCNPEVHIMAENYREDEALPPAGKLLFKGFGVDLIFSGHVSLMVTSLHHLHDHAHLTGSWYDSLWWLAFMVSIYIVLSHCHYSICVAISWMASADFYRRFAGAWHRWLSAPREEPTVERVILTSVIGCCLFLAGMLVWRQRRAAVDRRSI